MSLLCVVDDNEDICRLLKLALKHLGHEIKTFTRGWQLLQYLDEPLNPLPKLIILDYMMPELTGLETLSRLRFRPRMSLVPVAIFTAIDDATTMNQCLAAGAVAYWVKSRISLADLEIAIAALTRD
jgi:CheY-like chemotaxis protein